MQAAVGDRPVRLAATPATAVVAGTSPASSGTLPRGRARADTTATPVTAATGATQAPPYDTRLLSPVAIHVPPHGRGQTIKRRRLTLREPSPTIPRATVRAEGADVTVPIAGPSKTPVETIGAWPRPPLAGAGADAYLCTVSLAEATPLTRRLARQVLQGQEVTSLTDPCALTLAEGAPGHLGRLVPRDADVAPRPGPVAGPTRAGVETPSARVSIATVLQLAGRLVASRISSTPTGPATSRPIPAPSGAPVVQGAPHAPWPALLGIVTRVPRASTVAARTRTSDVLRIAAGDQAPPDAARDHARRLREGAAQVGQVRLEAVATVSGPRRATVLVPVASSEVGQRHAEIRAMDAVAAVETSQGAFPETLRGARQECLTKIRTSAPGAEDYQSP